MTVVDQLIDIECSRKVSSQYFAYPGLTNMISNVVNISSATYDEKLILSPLSL